MNRPLPLHRIAATEAQALSLLARGAMQLPLSNFPAAPSGALPTLALRHLGAAGSPLQPEDAMRTRLEWSGARLAIDVPKQAAEEWTRILMGGSAAAALPGPWRTYALERALEWAAGSLSALGKGTARVMESGLMATAQADGLRHRFLLSLDFADAAACIQAVLHCDNLGLLLLAGLLPQDTEPSHGVLGAADVPVRLHLTLGWTDLPLAHWKDLEPGDVVFVMQPLVKEPQGIALRAQVPHGPSRRLMARLEGHTVTVMSEAFAMNDQSDMPEDMDASAQTSPEQGGSAMDDAEPAQPLGRIALRLSFDVGHKDITLEELERLQPGEVLQLEQPASDYVTIRANGARVGTGTLVEVDGRVGVAITMLGGKRGSA